MDYHPSDGGEAATQPPLHLSDNDDLEDLVRQAFEAARDSGKPDWDTMTVAVLKNRLLKLSDTFSERKYGARTMSDLVSKIPDLVELDRSFMPPIVRLREGELEKNRRSYLGQQIRPDLWNAIVDYARGEPYVWAGGKAVPVSETHGGKDYLVFPTFSAEDLDGMRSAFAERFHNTGDDDQKESLESWRAAGKSVRALPSSLQRRWNTEFKEQVVQRLDQWFVENSIEPPDDMLASPRRPARDQPLPALQALRQFVIRCVEEMTLEELSELRLPPQVLMRGNR